MIEEYKKCSDICATTDYSDKKSVKKHNKAISRMYAIVRMVAAKEPEELEKFTSLLNEDAPARWLAHQLIELAEMPPDIEDKCFGIIESYAKGDSADAVGERMWLDEWEKKKGRV